MRKIFKVLLGVILILGSIIFIPKFFDSNKPKHIPDKRITLTRDGLKNNTKNNFKNLERGKNLKNNEIYKEFDKPIPKGMFSSMDKSKAYSQLITSSKKLEMYYKKFTDKNNTDLNFNSFNSVTPFKDFQKENENIYFFFDEDTLQMFEHLEPDGIPMFFLYDKPIERKIDFIIGYSEIRVSTINEVILHAEEKLKKISIKNPDKVGLYFELYQSLLKLYNYFDRFTYIKKNESVKDFSPEKHILEFKNNTDKLSKYLDKATHDKINSNTKSLSKTCVNNCDVETFSKEKTSEIKIIMDYVKENYSE